jgi:RNA polymerase-binding transcription factor DksA
MNPSQVEYFRSKLLQLRAGAQRELDGATAVGADDSAREGDQADQASAAADREFGIVNRERTQALLNQIEQPWSGSTTGPRVIARRPANRSIFDDWTRNRPRH